MQQAQTNALSTPEPKANTTVSGVSEPIEKMNPARVIRKIGSSFTPSIKDALAGKSNEQTITEAIGKVAFGDQIEQYETFSKEKFEAKWAEFLELISDRPNLYATLSSAPEIQDGNKLLLKVGNSVQEEEVRLIKPELVTFLRRELSNSAIELSTIIEKIESERTHFSDSEKMQLLVQKNPELLELKRKFNLDFNG
jgi:hypothetical protein